MYKTSFKVQSLADYFVSAPFPPTCQLSGRSQPTSWPALFTPLMSWHDADTRLCENVRYRWEKLQSHSKNSQGCILRQGTEMDAYLHRYKKGEGGEPVADQRHQTSSHQHREGWE
jgi:hypothetical protein